MRITSIVLSAVLLAFVTSGPATAEHHEMAGPAAGITFILDPRGNPGKVIEFSKRANAIAEKLGVMGMQRTFNIAFGGPTSDHMVIVVEFPNMAALAEASSKMSGNPEYLELSSEMRAAGIRLISRSIMVEVGK